MTDQTLAEQTNPVIRISRVMEFEITDVEAFIKAAKQLNPDFEFTRDEESLTAAALDLFDFEPPTSTAELTYHGAAQLLSVARGDELLNDALAVKFN